MKTLYSCTVCAVHYVLFLTINQQWKTDILLSTAYAVPLSSKTDYNKYKRTMDPEGSVCNSCNSWLLYAC